MKNTITVKNLCKNFGRLEVLSNLNFEFKKNEFIAIIGPSGCGKTTLLNILADLIKKDKGIISIFGYSPQQLRKQRKTSILFQDFNLLPWRTIKQNINLPNEIINKKHNNQNLIELVGLKKFQNYYLDQLSIGMQQRVALARALSINPEILLLDEPFSNLDELTRENLQIELLKIWEKKKISVIFVTHNIFEAVFLADKVIVMSKRPAKIIETIKIELPRPRDFNIFTHKQFNLYVQKLRKMIKNEK